MQTIPKSLHTHQKEQLAGHVHVLISNHVMKVKIKNNKKEDNHYLPNMYVCMFCFVVILFNVDTIFVSPEHALHLISYT